MMADLESTKDAQSIEVWTTAAPLLGYAQPIESLFKNALSEKAFGSGPNSGTATCE